LAVFSRIQPCECMTTTTAIPTAGSALLISHISSSRAITPGAVSRPVMPAVAAAVIGRIGRWISSSAAPMDVVAPNSMDIPISQAATAPPSRLTTNNTTPLTVQIVASMADWFRSSLRTNRRSGGVGE
jgi:anti-sigma factor RsiW